MEKRRDGNRWAYEWPEYDLTVALAGLREASDGLWAEVTVRQISANGKGHIHGPVRSNLTSTRTRGDLARHLQTRTAGEAVDWPGLIEQLCAQTVGEYREGSPIVRLVDVTDRPDEADLVPGFLPAGQTSILYGPGGALKSTLLDALGIAVASGAPFIKRLVPAIVGPVLYLDWETDEWEQRDRMAELARGAGLPALPANIHYRTCYRPLADDAELLTTAVAALGARLVIIDSLAWAAGPEPETAGAAIRTTNALRGFGPEVTRLCAAHMTHAGVKAGGTGAVYGSVFWTNAARAIWEVRKSEEGSREGEALIGLYQTKANRGGVRKPFGIRVRFEGEFPRSLERVEMKEIPELADRLKLSERVRYLLGKGALNVGELAEATGEEEPAVRMALRRMPDAIRIQNGVKGQPALWGLKGNERP